VSVLALTECALEKSTLNKHLVADPPSAKNNKVTTEPHHGRGNANYVIKIHKIHCVCGANLGNVQRLVTKRGAIGEIKWYLKVAVDHGKTGGVAFSRAVCDGVPVMHGCTNRVKFNRAVESIDDVFDLPEIPPPALHNNASDKVNRTEEGSELDDLVAAVANLRKPAKHSSKPVDVTHSLTGWATMRKNDRWNRRICKGTESEATTQHRENAAEAHAMRMVELESRHRLS
jgi:hypothetical protein